VTAGCVPTRASQSSAPRGEKQRQPQRDAKAAVAMPATPETLKAIDRPLFGDYWVSVDARPFHHFFGFPHPLASCGATCQTAFAPVMGSCLPRGANNDVA